MILDKVLRDLDCNLAQVQLLGYLLFPDVELEDGSKVVGAVEGGAATDCKDGVLGLHVEQAVEEGPLRE